ncbi:MAG: DegT/DnrJ/EryC1/StrS family aminotransferase [Elusimicrobia bacterium]|nr:DegT/DnrJ/EryC1/StrS family aminotransferase [Elusimicrobiota bacterium]
MDIMPAAEIDWALSVYHPRPADSPWRLDALFSPSLMRHYSLGRWALLEALKIAGVGAGDAVLLPGFICREALFPLDILGARPLFYELGPGLDPRIEPDQLPPAKAVIAVNFFGFPQDLSLFERYCRRHGALLIEDNAHGLFSRDESGRLLGTRAPLGVLSPRKTLPLPDGGALLVNDARLAERSPRALPPAAGRGPSRRSLLRRAAPWLGARAMAYCLGAARSWRAAARERTQPPGSPNPCPELLAPLSMPSPDYEARRRRALYLRCESLIGHWVKPVFPALPASVVPYLFAYRADPEPARRAESLLMSEGLWSLPWPGLPESVSSTAPGHYRNVRGVHFLW